MILKSRIKILLTIIDNQNPIEFIKRHVENFNNIINRSNENSSNEQADSLNENSSNEQAGSIIENSGNSSANPTVDMSLDSQNLTVDMSLDMREINNLEMSIDGRIDRGSNSIDDEINRYFSGGFLDEDCDKYYLRHKLNFPSLFKLYRIMACYQVSNQFVERTNSIAGYRSTKRNTKLAARNFQSLIYVKENYKFCAQGLKFFETESLNDVDDNETV